MRIQIIGYSGSGKSTLAKNLAAFYKIPCLHLDNVHFYGDWEECSENEMRQIVQAFLRNNDDWIIDGNYTDIAPERFVMSDVTIFLSYPRFYCYKKCKQRFLENRGHNRDSCPCEEHFDWEFKRWVLWDGRTKLRRKLLHDALSLTAGEKVILRNLSELEQWLHKHKIEFSENYA